MSSGFYKYRCKYFLTHNCPNWVYCHGHPCALCLVNSQHLSHNLHLAAVSNHSPQAEGRDADESRPAMSSHSQFSTAWRQQMPPTSTDICVPQAIQGTLRYTVMEIIPAEDSASRAYWVLREKAMAPRPVSYATHTTSDTPRAVMAPVGISAQMAY